MCALSYGAASEAEKGERAIALAMTCSGCHSASNRHIPLLGDSDPDRIYELLIAFREDRRVGTVMNRLAKGYSEADLRLISEQLGQ